MRPKVLTVVIFGSKSGSDGVWVREHRKVRRSLFTPMRIANGPKSDTHFLKIRETRAVNAITMRTFRVVDDWTQSSNSHKVLDFPWIGKTTFRLVEDTLMEVSDGEGAKENDSQKGHISSVCFAAGTEACQDVPGKISRMNETAAVSVFARARKHACGRCDRFVAPGCVA